jgi:hypothetical protein
MGERRSRAEELGAIEGADDAALGLKPPQPAATGAEVPGDVHLVPGSTADDGGPETPKPWFTNLAANSDQAGVGNDPTDAQAEQFPLDDKGAIETHPTDEGPA